MTGRRPPLRQVARASVIAVAIALLIWLGIFALMPPIGGMTSSGERIALSFECIALAATFTLLVMVEAVAHQRLGSSAMNPLFGGESERLRVDARVLQNTLEQFALFAPALILLAIHCRDGVEVRAVVAATIVWTLARFAFWIGYHIDPLFRVPGLVGYAQTVVMLLYGVARSGYEWFGLLGGFVPLISFAAIEVILVRGTRSPPASNLSKDGR